MKLNHLNRKILAGLVVLAGITGTALAQGAPGAGYGCGGMGPQGGAMGRQAAMKFDPAQHAERHLAMLKYQIKVTDVQEPLWQAYEQQVKAEAGKGFQAMRAKAADEKLTAPERMAKMQSLMEERLVAMKGVHVSFNRLYEALTPEQKAAADQFAARMGAGPRGMPRRMQPPQAAPQS